jgi:hypothetical protein
MDATESAILSGYRTRIDAGEELPPQQFARYQDLVALEVRAFVDNLLFQPHIYFIIPILFNKTNTDVSIIYLFCDRSSPHRPGSRYVNITCVLSYIVKLLSRCLIFCTSLGSFRVA